MSSIQSNYELDDTFGERLLLSKFSEDFKEILVKNVHAKYAFTYLLNGGNPHHLIEHLIGLVSIMADKMDEVIKHSPPAPIIITKEQYERLI